MMKFLKKAAVAVVALAVLATALLSAGCSTPKVAMTVDGTDYTTGEYLAYLYNSFYQIYVNQSLYYYDLYGGGSYDVWNETYTYDDEDKTEYDLVGYIKRSAQDSIIRQVAIMRLMDENGITLSDEDQKTIADELAAMKKDAYLEYGFNNDSYARMFREYNFNERTLFYALYGEGGKKAVAADEIRKYFDDNYLSYKIISFPLKNAEGKDLSEAEIKKIGEDLNGYLKKFTDGATFDEVIAQYKKDTEAASSTATTTTTGNGTTTTTAATTTEATTTTAAETTTEAATTTTTAAGESATETVTDPNRVDIDSAQTGDKELVKALKEMKFDEAKVIDYTTDAGVKTKALVLKLDPEAGRGKDKDGNEIKYFDEQKEPILYQLKKDEFNADVKAKVDTLEVSVNETVIKKCDPYEFRSMMAGNAQG